MIKIPRFWNFRIASVLQDVCHFLKRQIFAVFLRLVYALRHSDWHSALKFPSPLTSLTT